MKKLKDWNEKYKIENEKLQNILQAPNSKPP